MTVDLSIASAQTTGGGGSDTLSGFENLTGSAFADTLAGDGAANVLDGGADNDQLAGGGGADTLIGGAGNDGLNGGLGVDTANYAGASAGVTLRLVTLTAQNTIGAGTDTLAGIENLTGSSFADILNGDAGANAINGGDGDDIVLGGAGDDLLNGLNGLDTLSYLGAASGVTIDISLQGAFQDTGGAGIDRVFLFESVRGSAFGDALTGTAVANTLNGAEGNDTLSGAAGADRLIGGLGDDTVNGGDGQDRLSGEDGADTINGDAGNDNITSEAGADVVSGGAGADIVDAGTGDDRIAGGAGLDKLTGGTGADVFVYTSLADSRPVATGRDLILDFAGLDGDRIDIAAIDAVAGGGDDVFTVVTAFDGVAGQLRVTGAGPSYSVQGDVDGDRAADFAILVTSGAALTAGDFLL